MKGQSGEICVKLKTKSMFWIKVNKLSLVFLYTFWQVEVLEIDLGETLSLIIIR